jgi:hypothetical protein
MRGILFSLAIMLLGTSLLAMAIFLSGQPSKASRASSWLLDMDRASHTRANIDDALAGLVSRSINFSVENGTLGIEASLPWDSRIGEDISKFELFEENYSDANADMDLQRIRNGSFKVMPVNASVEQSGGNFSIVPQDGSGVAGYYLMISFPEGGFDNVTWAPSNGSGDLMPVYVRLQGGEGQPYYIYQGIDRNGESILSIGDDGGFAGQVRFHPPSALELLYVGNIGLKASVGFTSQVYVETEDMVSISHSANQSRRVRVA